MVGSWLLSGIGQDPLNLFEDLLVVKEVLVEGAAGAGSHAAATALAERLVQDGHLPLLAECESVVGAEADAGATAGAELLDDIRGVGLQLHEAPVDEGQRFGGGTLAP